jgi:hypothetical protein
LHFIVANYGTRHLGLLLAHLHSVARTHPEARQSVYWQDIPECFVTALGKAFPRTDWVRTVYDFDRDPLQRISSKVLCWSRAAAEHEGEKELIFCDSDTLVRRDLSGFFPAHAGADVVFTAKPEKVPLNSGVLLARGGMAATAFFRGWREATLEILRTPEKFAQANDSALPYGGTDQMSLHQMLGYSGGRNEYTLRCGEQDVRLQAEACARLNETNSRPLSGTGDEVCVIHYKAGWQRILLDGRPFSRFRPRAASWEMLVFFQRTFAEALAHVNAVSGEHFTQRDFNLQRLWYYRDGDFSWPGYVAWRAREAAKRGWLMATGRLKKGM